MPESLLHSAVRNNADWCALVAASHDVPNSWNKKVWCASGKMPPFYPNVVTLKDGITNEQASEIAESLPKKCAWKDSFADLDLTDFGFKVAFEAQWYGLSETLATQLSSEPVHEVSSEEELENWVSAWGETPDGQSIFTSKLLEPRVRFLFRRTAGEIDSGLIANLSDDVVGISNTFGHPDGIAQCISKVSETNNGFPLVGYGSEDDLRELSKLGFVGLGKLRIWLR